MNNIDHVWLLLNYLKELKQILDILPSEDVQESIYSTMNEIEKILF